MIYTILIIIAVIACAISVFMSVSIMREQAKHSKDHIHPTVAKHPLMANAIVILYLAFPILVLIGGLLWWYMDVKGLT
ncbi:hypothetical protein MUG84_11450 [Paenibacillus sp. KQZ6P-2]|uniref:Uncharacterized protein n=1 Tax=Paenibacillus mangrovi TaxID=2931978 RepID=A0A9X2B2H8_9BACL|nr:hypothetical protein [Paenibacillus mangrovi]MCJ8012346.1 hypothetical protein [Paenibacillus mangrovi]